ncbi:MAG: hypothetical protein G01um101419_303 [Parcubacteria group bacterium Gr01-1014_19]|nr:MAG: hypothetical protein G01um101419_303 [Parcubacteria group bacterium Gr01-1014_19]
MNYLPIVLSAIASMVLGTLWYGPIFGKIWIKEMKFTEEAMAEAKKKGMAKTYLVAFVGALVTAYVLSYVLGVLGADSWMAAAKVSLWIWLGFIATVKLGDVLWNGRSLKLFVLESSYYLVNLLAMSAVLTNL